ncbi:hypothetical protein LINPERHAP1_LOCUS27455 [Linum perenne]
MHPPLTLHRHPMCAEVVPDAANALIIGFIDSVCYSLNKGDHLPRTDLDSRIGFHLNCRRLFLSGSRISLGSLMFQNLWMSSDALYVSIITVLSSPSMCEQISCS